MRLLGLLVVAVVVAVAGDAHAYPQFTLSQAQTCAACHTSPSGAGLLDDMGNFTAEDISSRGGAPEFMWGAFELPEWLALGGDARSAIGANYIEDGKEEDPRFLAFPMQFDVYVQAGAKGFTVNATGGLRGSRSLEGGITSFLQSREHYLMWKQGDGAEGLYVRAGRFMPVYGLRLAEHTFYTRRYGQTSLFSETYGASVGWLSGGFEVHATGFMHDPIGIQVEKGDGGALYAEKRFGTRAALGVMGRYATRDEETRTAGGVTGKLWFESPGLLLQVELQGIHQQLTLDASNTDESRVQAIGQLLASWFIRQGWMLDVGVGYFQSDLDVAGTDRESFDLNLHYFAWSHIEFVLTNRVQLLDLGGDRTSGYSLLQVHYRL
jgi:hypothetical protein